MLPGVVPFNPTHYRYAAVIERTKQLVALAQQVEVAFLSALEKFDKGGKLAPGTAFTPSWPASRSRW